MIKMRQFLIDELSKEERDNIESYLKRTVKPGPINGMYLLEIPEDLLGPVQYEHPGCGPFYFCIETGDNTVSFEFLVRSPTNLHCSCIAYASPDQRDFLLRFIDTLLEEESIKA